MSLQRKEVVAKEGQEQYQDHNLQNQARLGNVDTHVHVFCGVGGCGEASTGGLEDETGDVCGNEDPVEQAGVEAGEGDVCSRDAAKSSLNMKHN